MSYFHASFTNTGSGPTNEKLIRSIIPCLVDNNDNNILCVVPYFEKIRVMDFDLNSISVPGPDGFSGLFFLHCWEVVS